MMTNNLAQIAGEPTRQATEGGDETDPEVLAARAAAELPAGFLWGAATSACFTWSLVDHAAQRRTRKSGARWYSNLMRAQRSAGDPT